jgi:hypothetical protein
LPKSNHPIWPPASVHADIRAVIAPNLGGVLFNNSFKDSFLPIHAKP